MAKILARIMSVSVRDPRRIAPVGHEASEARGDAEPPLRHGQQHHAAVGCEPTAVEIGCDLAPPNGWKTNGGIVSWVMAGVAGVTMRECLVSHPNLRNISSLDHARQSFFGHFRTPDSARNSSRKPTGGFRTRLCGSGRPAGLIHPNARRTVGDNRLRQAPASGRH